MLETLAKRSPNGKYVVLIDEYDAPISGLVDSEEGRQELPTVRKTLHDFYVQAKAQCGNMRFLMVTGVSKFAKTSVFSAVQQSRRSDARSPHSGPPRLHARGDGDIFPRTHPGVCRCERTHLRGGFRRTAPAVRQLSVFVETPCQGRQSRPDSVVKTGKAIYIVEFKYNRSADAALAQCREKRYADAYADDGRRVTYVGVNYDSKARTINEVKTEPVR